VLKQIGKLLSILAMMAAAINAQCALSCSLQANQPAVADQHACCKSHKTPVDQKRAPCRKDYVTVEGVSQVQAPDQLLVPATAFSVIQLSVDARIQTLRQETHRAPDIPPFTNLRI